MKVWIVYKPGAMKPIEAVYSSKEAAEHDKAKIEALVKRIRPEVLGEPLEYEIAECEVTGLTYRGPRHGS